MITRLDHAVGDVLSLLEELQIDDQTLVFFASDNGCSLRGYDRDRLWCGSASTFKAVVRHVVEKVKLTTAHFACRQ